MLEVFLEKKRSPGMQTRQNLPYRGLSALKSFFRRFGLHVRAGYIVYR